MTMMDDPNFLIAHIRNSFITSDDTGMCEMIMEHEDLALPNRVSDPPRTISCLSPDINTSDSGVESSDVELSHSYDILPDMDYGTHRRRSNTAVRLERLKKEKKNQVKVKHISWRNQTISDKALESDVFVRKHIVHPNDASKPSRKSLLSDLIDTYGAVSNNPFMEFSKFDGRANLGVLTKKIDIFLTMASPRDRPYPMTIVIISSVKVRDLIGYICWQYTTEGREPPLLENLNAYAIHIAEDDGEVDDDFPCLDIKEPVSKFGFSKLALVEKAAVVTPKLSYSVLVTFNIPGKGFSKVPIDDLDTTLRDVLSRVVSKRKMITHPGVEYNIEKQGQPGIALDLDRPLSSFTEFDFCLVRRNSCRGDLSGNEAMQSSDSFSSHHYKMYTVCVVHKLRARTDVQLGISGTKIDIDPISRKTSSRMFRFKAMTLDMESIIGCNCVNEKSNEKTTFRLTYLTNSEEKHIYFETAPAMAAEIVQKISNILEWRLPPIETTPTTVDHKLQKKRDPISKLLNR